MADSTATLEIVVMDGTTEKARYSPVTYLDNAADEYGKLVIDAPNGAAVNVDVDSLVGTAITQFAVKNMDGATPIVVTWTDSGANANTQVVPANGMIFIPDVDAGTDPTLEGTGGICQCEVFYAGT